MTKDWYSLIRYIQVLAYQIWGHKPIKIGHHREPYSSYYGCNCNSATICSGVYTILVMFSQTQCICHGLMVSIVHQVMLNFWINSPYGAPIERKRRSVGLYFFFTIYCGQHVCFAWSVAKLDVFTRYCSQIVVFLCCSPSWLFYFMEMHWAVFGAFAVCLHMVGSKIQL